MIIDLPLTSLPLCPSTNHPLHLFHVELQNAAYNSAPKDKNLEFAQSDADAMYSAISYGQFSGRMHLYREENYISKFGYLVEAYYYRCSICNTVIPASRVDRPS